MISKLKDELLGVGIYTPAEAAMYARVRTQLLTRWLFGSKHGAPVVCSQLRGQHDRTVTFLDFVQALAIRAIRLQYPQITLGKIRKAVANAERYCQSPYPFAMRHTTYVFLRDEDAASTIHPADDEADTPACEIVFEKDQRLLQLTGTKAGNQMIPQVAELYMQDITYNDEGLAVEYVAYERGGRKVVINPQKHFGEPLLPSGYTASALWEAAKVEGGIDAAAVTYGVDRTEVELACAYFDFLQGPTSA